MQVMDATDRFEALAKQFHKDTGMFAPGKDVPAALGGGSEYDYRERTKAWVLWLEHPDTAVFIKELTARTS